MKRVPEVIDCWFDSGAMPFAQHHYPCENKELFESQFPAQFISEAVDQTRGWSVSYTHLDVYKRQQVHIVSETYNQDFTIDLNHLEPSEKKAGTVDLVKNLERAEYETF